MANKYVTPLVYIQQSGPINVMGYVDYQGSLLKPSVRLAVAPPWTGAPRGTQGALVHVQGPLSFTQFHEDKIKDSTTGKVWTVYAYKTSAKETAFQVWG